MNDETVGKSAGTPSGCRSVLGRNRAEIAATMATFAVLGAALYLACRALDAWAANSFAQPIMASALVAVCDLGLLLVALSLAPALSAAFLLPLRRIVRAGR
jgi:hypothetical protein